MDAAESLRVGEQVAELLATLVDDFALYPQAPFLIDRSGDRWAVRVTAAGEVRVLALPAAAVA